MGNLLQSITDQSFMPHGYCFSWNPALLWTFVISDLVIAISYFSIPFALWYFASKRTDIHQRNLIFLLGLFIIACGVTHVLDVLTIWNPMYWTNAVAKSITAFVSFATAIVLWKIMPSALRAPSSEQLQDANKKLEESRAVLEERVNERTAELAQSEEQIRFVLEGAELAFWDWDIPSGKVARNERWAQMLGYTHQEITDTLNQWTDFIHPDDRKLAWQSINDVLNGITSQHKIEYRMLHKNGSIRWVLDRANIMQRDANGKPIRMSGIHIDVTERKQLELKLQQQANFDFLTGAANRGYFIELAEMELNRSSRYNKPFSLFMMDIDHFKQVNDTHGHKVGDEVLKILVAICQTALREVDVIGRIGGEEFAILLPETSGEEAAEVAERLRDTISQYALTPEQGSILQFTVSIGVASVMPHKETVDVILNWADKALYEAKHAGRNQVKVFADKSA